MPKNKPKKHRDLLLLAIILIILMIYAYFETNYKARIIRDTTDIPTSNVPIH